VQSAQVSAKVRAITRAASGAVNLFARGATLGAARTNALEGIRTRVNSEQGSVRGHGLI